MSILSEVLTDSVFDLESCTKEELEIFKNRFSEVNSSIATSLEAIGTMMFWAAAGNADGNHRIPEREAIDAFSQIGELMQILSALSDFSLSKEDECGGRLRVTENNEAPKTAINGASNIQPTTI